MRWVVVGLLFLSGAAEASFRDQPPRSLHLVDAGGWGAGTGMALLTATGGEVTPPPLVSAPESPPPAVAAPPEKAPVLQSEVPPADSAVVAEIPVDPYAGTYVGKEVLGGLLGVLGADLISAGTGIGVMIVTLSSTSGEFAGLAAFAYGVLTAGLLDLALAPLAAALGAYAAAPREGNNGLFGAALAAYGTQLVATSVSVVVYLMLAVAAQGAGSSFDAIFSALSFVGGTIGMALHYVGLPLAASYGIHWTGAVNRARTVASRRPAALPITPEQFYVQATAPRASPLLAIRF